MKRTGNGAFRWNLKGSYAPYCPFASGPDCRYEKATFNIGTQKRGLWFPLSPPQQRGFSTG